MLRRTLTANTAIERTFLTNLEVEAHVSEFQTMLVVVTGLGALPVFVRSRVSHRTYDSALGLAAGIVGVFIGGFSLLVANKLIPHLHTRYTGWRGEGGAITLHNAPEGLAMGVAFASGLDEVAFLLAVVIGLQNVPDGFAFALPMSDTGMTNGRVLLYTTLSGLVPQVAAAIFGFGVVAVATGVFPVAAGFAAGAMMAVVFREMIPSSHGHGYADAATAAFLVGFSLLVVVDQVLVI